MQSRNDPHGHNKKGKRTPEYRAWAHIKSRCYNKRTACYKDYGARGISMCEEWRQSFPAFLRDVGLRPAANYTLDRIKNDGNYEPGNVRWATRKTQAQNRRSNYLITAFGRTQCLKQWAEEYGIGWSTIRARIQAGLTPEQALTHARYSRIR